MRALFMTALVGFAAVSALAIAQPGQSHPPRQAATLCLDGSGENHAPVCHSHSASRFASAPDICQCHGPWRQVEAPYCAAGERAPNDTAAFEQARAKAAEDGSLFGDTYQGKPMCVELRNGY